MPEGWRPRGATPHLRSGAVAESARMRRRRNRLEEPPQVQGQGRRPGGATPCPRSGAVAGRSYLASEVRSGGWEELPHFKVRGSGREEQPHLQGAVAVGAQEGLEEILHVQGQEGRQ